MLAQVFVCLADQRPAGSAQDFKNGSKLLDLSGTRFKFSLNDKIVQARRCLV